MKITGIEIEQFGPWNELSMPIASDGLTVLSGANESGKTALQRFIRGVLFGFRADDAYGYEAWMRRRPSTGSLQIRLRGQSFEIRRAAHDGGHGLVTSRWLAPANAPRNERSLIEHCDWETDDEADSEFRDDSVSATLPLTDPLQQVLGDLPEKLFDQVYSLGLRELHELSVLADDDVARAVHGETLGPYGQTLLAAREEMTQATTNCWNTARPDALPCLLQRFEQLNNQILSQAARVERYSELMSTRRHHERRLADLQTRRASLQEQLRGYTHIERVWTPWQRLRNLQAELLRLPRIDDFPEGGIARFDIIEEELRTALKCRETLLTEAKQFHRDAKKIAVPRELRQCSSGMRSLLEQREHIGRLEERARTAHATLKQQKDKLDTQVQSLGADWSAARLEALDTSVAAHYRLVEKARQFRKAASRQNKWRQRLQRLSQKCQQQQLELDEALKKLGGLSLEEALRKSKQRQPVTQTISMLAPIARPVVSASSVNPDVEHVRMRIVELEQRRVSISRQIERLEPRLILPKWVMSVLAFFAIGGVLLAIIGVVTGFATNALSGAAYALLGTVCGGLALSLKLHFEQQVRDSIASLHEELRDNEVRLREARDSWQTMTGSESNFTVPAATEALAFAIATSMEQPADRGGCVPHPTPPTFNETNSDNLPTTEDLERLIALKQELIANQRKRAPWKDRFESAARDVATTRQTWCETLTQLGLPESIRVTETFDLWQRLAAAGELLKAFRSTETEFKRQLENIQNFRSRIVEILHRLNRRDLEQRQTNDVFQIWEELLTQLTTTLQDRLRLRREERRRRAEASEYHEKIEDLRLQRSALLRQGCATDRDDYERRATIVARHAEVLRNIDAAKDELMSASSAIPELAIVEDDLLRFDSSQHSATLTRLRREEEEVNTEISSRREDMGRVRAAIEQLETDEEHSDLRLEREIVRTQITAAAQQWLADEWVAQTLDGIRTRYERVCQPGVLAAASRYLSRLTSGKYRTLWTPLQHRSLRVDDASGSTWRLDQLSGSTRELLLLAIRLALVDEFSKRGLDLPLILDDVLLTLDPARAAVAASELVDFAHKGHQVLFFTCHPHLTSLFTNAGCPNIRLSQYAANTERLAG